MSIPPPPYLSDYSNSHMISSSDQDPHPQIMYPYNGKIMVVAVAALLLVISLVLLLHVYAKWWFLRHSSPPRRLSPLVSGIPSSLAHIQHLTISLEDDVMFDTGDTGVGLDASAVASLPIFVYKSDEHRSAVQCVICLCTLVDDEKGRILPKCQHEFHVGCIDMWLHSHSNCPICRAPVVVPGEAMEASVALEEVSHEPPGTPNEQAVVMDENPHVLVEVEISQDLDLRSQMQKDSSSLSSSSLSSASSASLSCSLKRMLSWNRNESKVFPSSTNNVDGSCC